MNLKQILAVICFMTCAAGHMSAEVMVTDTLGGVKSIAASPAEIIRGEVSGVRVSAVDGSPNGLLNVNLRGLNTLRGDSQPLWIVDGAVIGSSVNQNLNSFYLSGGSTINGDKLPDYSGRSYTVPVGNFSWLNPYDIESVEVLKDMSATALYGMQGANGVIIIKTRRPKSGENNIWLNSTVGADLPTQTGDAFKNGLVTSHDLGVNGVIGTNSYYNVSGFVRYSDASVQNAGSTSGGLNLALETVANDVFQFGLHSFLSYGDNTSSAGANFIGQPSTMILSRYPDAFAKDKLADWISSYDDEILDYRSVTSAWFNARFMRGLDLKFTGGVDYQNQTRYLWFGNNTSFGKEFSGATSILNNSLLNYNFKGELKFDRNFAVKHHVVAALAYDLNGYTNKTNTMCGTNFDLPYLRGKGLSSSGSLHAIRKFEKVYTQMGAYASAGYDYDGMAGANGGVRYDYTMRFDNEPLLLPFAEGYVNLHKIFLSDSKAVSALKLVGGYGMAGREYMMPYEYTAAYASNVPEVELGTEPYFDGFNRLVSTEWNVGATLGFLNNRINFSAKYYDKTTEDTFRIYNFGKILSGMWVDTENWQIHYERASQLRNSGFEFDADFRIIQTRNITWTARVNAAYNINSIVTLGEGDENSAVTDLIKKGTYLSANAEGLSVGQAYGFRLDAEGKPEAEPSLLGNTLPKYHGGFGTTLSLYGLTLDAKFSGVGGFNIINANSIAENGRDYITDKDLERGDYLRLDDLTLSYAIPVKARWIKGLKVSVSGHNLFTATGYSGWNPDVNCFGVNARSYGVDYGSYPIRRMAVLGLSVRF